MTPCLPPTGPAIAELRQTIAERREANATKPRAGGIARIQNLEQALKFVEFCEMITVFETVGNPTSPDFQPVD